jgi:molybdopterin-guanine dinucleotide biosynthesis protein A
MGSNRLRTLRQGIINAEPIGKEAEWMKAVILAGGLGTRFSEETNLCPKPMMEILRKVIRWHIIKIYAAVM